MAISVDKVRELDQAITKMTSLDAPIGEDGDGQVHDIIEDENLSMPNEQVENFLNKERARNILDELPEREREIISMRYGIPDGEPHTLAEIAEKMNISRERVRQLEVAILKKLKDILKQQDSGEIESNDKTDSGTKK